MLNCIIEMRNITKSFYKGNPNQLDILKNININIKKGEFVSIVGASGFEKSTLMNIIGVLDRQTSGEYTLDGIDISKINDDNLAQIRNKKIGFIFQNSNLIPRTSSLQNVELPMLYCGVEDRLNHFPSELSGGQRQRVAIARAFANNPDILLADEPTGSLDSQIGRIVMNIFHEIHEKQGKTIIFITHNSELASETQRTLTMKDGEVVEKKFAIIYNSD